MATEMPAGNIFIRLTCCCIALWSAGGDPFAVNVQAAADASTQDGTAAGDSTKASVPSVSSVAASFSVEASSGIKEVAGTVEAQAEWFETQIRPLLAERCIQCHGSEKQGGGLRLDARQHLLTGGDRGPAFQAGNQESSLIVRAVRRQDLDLQMPPDEPLTADQLNALEKWILDGAYWPQGADGVDIQLEASRHWAFKPVTRPVAQGDPNGAELAGTSTLSPIDAWIRHGYGRAGLQAVPTADRRTLIRRMHFDLLGLAPEHDEVDQFVADESPDAVSNLIDRLLQNPAYGERWGRHWMDVVRYADTAGDNADYPIPEIRLYRDYIINSLNADKPYDQFVQEQLAGDLMVIDQPDRKAEQTIATGFLALSRRYATAPYELWHLTLEDSIDTIGRGLLGITFRCARCHDHKFDPVTMQDYYGLYGILDSTKFPYAGSEEYQSMNKPRQGFVPLVSSEELAVAEGRHVADLLAAESALNDFSASAPESHAFRDAQQQLQAQEERLKSSESSSPEERAAEMQRLDELRKLVESKAAEQKKARTPLERKLKALRLQGVPNGIAAAYAVSEGMVHDVPLQMKGDPGQPGAVVPRQVPQFIAGDELTVFPSDQSGRLQLARWLTSRRNPLFARVMVNRVWLEHFGSGLVGTPSNFGLRGEKPFHPELLDYLAWQFVERGWSLKSLHREILLSETWQLSSQHSPNNAAADPDNRFYWRQNRRRLDAESLRDAMLQVSGMLDLSRPERHPFPEPPHWNWTQHNPFRDHYPSSHRSVYLMTQRLQRHPYLALFDGPDTNSSVEKRTNATVPLQALYLLNSPELQTYAAGFSERIQAAEANDESRIHWAWRQAFQRLPSPTELLQATDYLKRYRNMATTTAAVAVSTPENTAAVNQAEAMDVWKSFAKLLMISNEFLYMD